MRSAFRGPAHQLAVRVRINNCTHGHYGPSNQPCTSNCTSAEGLHFSAFHYYGSALISGNVFMQVFTLRDQFTCIIYNVKQTIIIIIITTIYINNLYNLLKCYNNLKGIKTLVYKIIIIKKSCAWQSLKLFSIDNDLARQIETQVFMAFRHFRTSQINDHFGELRQPKQSVDEFFAESLVPSV